MTPPRWADRTGNGRIRAAKAISRVELSGDTVGQRHVVLDEMRLRVRDVKVGPDGLVYALVGGESLVRLQPAG